MDNVTPWGYIGIQRGYTGVLGEWKRKWKLLYYGGCRAYNELPPPPPLIVIATHIAPSWNNGGIELIGNEGGTCDAFLSSW